MLRVLGSNRKLCHGVSRRDFLHAGALGAGGLRLKLKLIDNGAQPECEKSKRCLSEKDRTCWAELNGDDETKVTSFRMKVFAFDMYVSRSALCTGRVREFHNVEKALRRLRAARTGTFLRKRVQQAPYEGSFL